MKLQVDTGVIGENCTYLSLQLATEIHAHFRLKSVSV